MSSQNLLHNQLLQFNIDSNSLSNKQIQDQILAIYDLIELKVQENMILKKENLDLQLQFTTIQDLFENVTRFQQTQTQECLQVSPYAQFHLSGQMLIHPHLPCPIYNEEQSQMQEQDNYDNNSNKLQNSSWTLSGTVQKTQRKGGSKNSSNLQEKIEKLLCQNQHILQRLQQIEEHIQTNGTNNVLKSHPNGFSKNEKSRIEYGKGCKGQQEVKEIKVEDELKENTFRERASIYKWQAINTATSRSSMNPKGKEN